MKYPDKFFHEFERKLESMASKGSPRSANKVQAQFARIWPKIEICMQKGFTYKELFEAASELGFEASFSSFKSYLMAARGKKKPRKTRATKPSAKKVAQKVNGKVDSAVSKPGPSQFPSQRKVEVIVDEVPTLKRQSELFSD